VGGKLNTQLIITHPGSAHFDEVTAICLVLAVNTDSEFQIERREPSGIELDDSNVWVIDTGKRYEPPKRNFDHHQSLDCPASFVLVARYLGLEDALSVTPWWRFKDSVDRIGPVKSSAIFQAGDDLVNRNPVEEWLTSCFASEPQNSLPLLRSFGLNLIDSAQGLKKQIDFWKTARRIMIAGRPAVIGETRESYGLEEFRRLDKSPPDIVVSLDRQGNGWRLFRYDGTPVDFNRIADSPEVEFAHKSGFLAKTRERLPVDTLIDLVSKAVIPNRE
jgi:hypothetical protein